MNAFQNLVGDIDQASKLTGNFVAQINVAQNHVGDAVSITSELLLDVLTQPPVAGQPKPTLAEVSEFAAVIYKLVQSIHQLSGLADDRRELLEKSLTDAASVAGFSPELLAELERKLNLLG